MADAKPKSLPGNPILREIVAKREQAANQILRGEPADYPAYRSALGAYQTLVQLEQFTLEQLKKGDHVDD